jgi:protein-S-isoprenylcysteine O-methyltransferase Ste14
MPTEADHANVIVPPPIALILCLGAAWAATGLRPAPFLPESVPRTALGAAVLLIGLSVALSAAFAFRRAGTALRPDRPSTRVIARGPYRYSRNPIYLSMFLTIVAAALASNSLWQLAGLAVFYPIIRWGVVAREEAYLARKFGPTYADYVGRVRRWL